jgi:hypothetical protein
MIQVTYRASLTLQMEVNVPLKRLLIFNRIHDAKSQKTESFQINLAQDRALVIMALMDEKLLTV